MSILPTRPADQRWTPTSLKHLDHLWWIYGGAINDISMIYKWYCNDISMIYIYMSIGRWCSIWFINQLGAWFVEYDGNDNEYLPCQEIQNFRHIHTRVGQVPTQFSQQRTWFRLFFLWKTGFLCIINIYIYVYIIIYIYTLYIYIWYNNIYGMI